MLFMLQFEKHRSRAKRAKPKSSARLLLLRWIAIPIYICKINTQTSIKVNSWKDINYMDSWGVLSCSLWLWREWEDVIETTNTQLADEQHRAPSPRLGSCRTTSGGREKALEAGTRGTATWPDDSREKTTQPSSILKMYLYFLPSQTTKTISFHPIHWETSFQATTNHIRGPEWVKCGNS